MKTNPTIKEFLEDYPKVTVLGLYWAGAWRFIVLYFAFIVLLLGLVKIFE